MVTDAVTEFCLSALIVKRNLNLAFAGQHPSSCSVSAAVTCLRLSHWSLLSPLSLQSTSMLFLPAAHRDSGDDIEEVREFLVVTRP